MLTKEQAQTLKLLAYEMTIAVSALNTAQVTDALSIYKQAERASKAKKAFEDYLESITEKASKSV